MRSRLASCVILLCAAAPVVAAQQFTRDWLRVAPEGEEFAVHMPEPHYRIRRELPFGKAVTLKPASFEITYRGALLSVLSFSKSAPSTPKTLASFLEGFRHALGKGGVEVVRRSEREAKLDGRAGAELGLSMGDMSGAARVFETDEHFYAVLTLGGAASSSVVQHFHDSFTLDKSAADRVPLKDTEEASASPVKRPAPLWPVAGSGGGGTSDILVGDRDIAAPAAGAPKGPPVDVSGKSVVSGGLLNGKIIVKPQPAYPPIAKAARAQGTVTVQILVDEEGYVIEARAVSGHPLLQQAAVFAARQVRFTPTYLLGQPVKVSGVITYNFVLA